MKINKRVLSNVVRKRNNIFVLVFGIICVFASLIIINKGTYSVDDVDSLVLNCPSSANIGGDFECSVILKSTSIVTEGLVAKYNFSEDLNFVSFSAADGWTAYLSDDDGFVVVHDEGVSGNDNLVGTVKYTISDTANYDSVFTVGLTDIEIGDGNDTTLNLIAVSTNVGITQLSTVNTLESISLTNGTLNESFNRDTTEYTASASSMTVTVNVTKTDEKSTVSGVGEVNLNYGTNTIEIVVTSESGISKKYTITIIKEFILSDEDITGDFIYNGDEKFIYIGNREINYSILNYIKVPSDLNKEVDVYNNMMVISNSSEVLSRIRIFNFSVTGLNINVKNIDLDEGLIYDNFINKINMVDGLSYRVYKGNEVITTGNMEDGMILNIYYEDLELDSYNIRLDNSGGDDEIPRIILDDSLNVIEGTKYITYVLSGTTVAEFKELIDSEVGDLFIMNSDGEKSDNDIIKTGDFIVLYDNNNVIDEYFISVLGDSNGDGLFNQLDITHIRKHIVGWQNPVTGIIFERTGIYSYGLDINKDGEVNQLDVTKMRKIIVGLDTYE